MQRFARVEIWSNYVGAGGTRLAFVPDVASVVTTRDVTGDDSLELTIPRNSPVVAQLIPGRVLRVVRRDETGATTFDEWRIADRTRASGRDADTYRYTARSPRADLVRGIVSQVLASGETQFVFGVVSMTPAQIIDTYVLPALTAAGVTYFSRGTVTPTEPRDLTIEYQSPLAVLEMLRDLTTCELQVRINGTAGYYIDLVTQIGADAPRPVFRPRRNLLRHEQLERNDEQVTRCVPRGDRLPGLQEFHSLARMMFEVTNVSTSSGSITLTIADPAGSVTPIAFDDEFTGWFVFRQASGATFPITACSADDQQIVITSGADFAVGEFIELRVTDDHSQRVPIYPISPDSGANLFRLPYQVSVDGGVPERITIGTGAGDTISDWVGWDGQYRDLYVTSCEQILSIASPTGNASEGRLEVSSVTGVSVGDLVYLMNGASSANPPHGGALAATLFEVTQVDAVNKYLYLTPHYENRASDTLPSTTFERAVVIRRGTTRQVRTSLASSNTIDLTTPANAAENGRILLIEQRCAGVLPSYVDDPVAVQEYGIIPRPLDKSSLRGEGNLIWNPRFARWSSPTDPPDGWTVETTLTAQHSQNTDPRYIRYGVRSWELMLLGSGIVTRAITPRFYAHRAGFFDLRRVAIRLSLYVAEFQGSSTISVRVRSAGSGRTPVAPVIQLYSPGYGIALTDEQEKLRVSPGQFLDLTIPAVDLGALESSLSSGGPVNQRDSDGYQLEIRATSSTSGAVRVRIYMDAVAVYQVPYDPGLGGYVEGSFANQLLDAAHRQLKAYARPTVEITTDLIDLDRVVGDTPITLGGEIDLRDSELGVTATPRVVRLRTNELDPADTQVTLSTRFDRLPTLLTSGTL